MRPRLRAALLAATMELLAVGGVCRAGSAVQVEATLTPRTIGIDERARLTIRASGSGFRGVDLNPTFHLDNLDVVGGPFESQQFQFSNGRASRSRSLTWELKPRGLGNAFVRQIRVQVGDETMRLPDQKVMVQQQPTGASPVAPGPVGGLPDPFANLFGRGARMRPTPAPSDTSPRVFLRSAVEPTDPYVGEQATYTLYLFTQVDVGGVSPESLPDFHGFWVKEIAQPNAPTAASVELEGRRYRRVILLQRALFPLRAGRQALDPAKVELQVRMANRSPFGDLFPQLERVERTSNRLAVQVRPLPPPPPDFSGAVGRLQMESELNPSTLRVGDAATLQIRLRGAGHLQGLSAPKIVAPTGVQIFTPQGNAKEDMHGRRVDSERVWSYPVVPRRTGHWDIEVPAFTYFDPAADAFRTVDASHLTLVARPPMEETATAAKGAGTADKAASSAANGTSVWPLDSAPIGWAGAGVVVLIGGLVWVVVARRRRHGAESALDPEFLSQLESIRPLRKPRRIARALEEAWRHLLSRQFDLPDRLEPARWADHLSDRDLDRGLCDRMRHIAADMHYLRYAPELAAVDTLRDDLLQRSRALARDLGR